MICQLYYVPIINLDGIDVEYAIVRSPRRKRVSIVIINAKVEIRCPSSVKDEHALAFLEDKKHWVIHHLKEQQTYPPAVELNFSTGEKIPLFGKDYLLEVKKGRKTQFSIENNAIVLFKRTSSSPTLIKKRLFEFYADVLLEYLTKRSLELKHIGIPEKIEIRSYRRKWGTCLPNGTLRFNWRLAMAPPDVIDLVLIHELIHTKIKNHSKLFFAYLSSYVPNHKELNLWLKKNAGRLNAI